MQKRGITLLIMAVLAGASVTRASITNVTYANYTGGMMTNAWAAWNSSQVSLSIHGEQLGTPGLGGGTIYTSSAEDPTLTVHNIIDNDTTFSWTAYHVNVSMSSTFTISNAVVNVPGDWTSVITQQPILTNSLYVGQVDYFSGTPVPIGGTLDFQFNMIFSGATQFSYTVELIPVPEPETLNLVAVSGILLGGFALGRRRRRA